MRTRSLQIFFVFAGLGSSGCYGWHVHDVDFADTRIEAESEDASEGSGPLETEATTAETPDTDSRGVETGDTSPNSDSIGDATTSTASGDSGETNVGDSETEGSAGSVDEDTTGETGDGDEIVCGHDKGFWRQHHAGAMNSKKQIPWPLPEDSQLCGRGWLDLLWEPNQGSTWRALAQASIVVRLNLALGVDSDDANSALQDSLTLLENCELEAEDEARAKSLLAMLSEEIAEATINCH